MNAAQELSIKIHPHLHLISSSLHHPWLLHMNIIMRKTCHHYYFPSSTIYRFPTIFGQWDPWAIIVLPLMKPKPSWGLNESEHNHHPPHHHHPWTFNEWWTPNSPVTPSDEINLWETQSWLNMSCTRDWSIWSSLTWEEEEKKRRRRRSRSREEAAAVTIHGERHRERLISRELW